MPITPEKLAPAAPADEAERLALLASADFMVAAGEFLVNLGLPETEATLWRVVERAPTVSAQLAQLLASEFVDMHSYKHGDHPLVDRVRTFLAGVPATLEDGYPPLPAGSTAYEFDGEAIVYEGKDMHAYVAADRALRAQCKEAAVNTLQILGYTYDGAEQWKPPIGAAPDFDLVDQLRGRIAELEQAQAAPVAEGVPACVVSGAVFDFAGYLTTLPVEKAIHASAAHEASPMVEAITAWAAERGLVTAEADVQGWRAALAATPAAGVPACTACGAQLKKVTQSPDSYLSADQFDADKLGDWFCDCCPKGPSKGSSSHRYFWDKDFATAQPAAVPAAAPDARDAAFEAVRNRLCGLQRYSFVLDDDGEVRRVQDRTGNWIEFDDAHELFDPVSVDAAIAAQAKEGGKAWRA